jgi:hypothetical protein
LIASNRRVACRCHAGILDKEISMQSNAGSIDRITRIGIGLGLCAAALTGVLGPWAWIGVVPLATGFVGFCPLYSLLGVNTCSMGRR